MNATRNTQNSDWETPSNTTAWKTEKEMENSIKFVRTEMGSESRRWMFLPREPIFVSAVLKLKAVLPYC